MEFACGYVYVPPSLSQKDAKRYNANKRSPLLPPITWVRPSTAPPAPPTDSARAKAQQTTIYEKAIGEDLMKGKQIKIVKRTAQNEKSASHKLEISSPKISVSGLTPPPKTALLPPHRKPTASTDYHTQPLVSRNVDSQAFTYDYVIPEPDFKKQPTDPENFYAIPKGSFCEVKQPADPGAVSTSTPPLPPRPQFMDYIPEYIMVLPSSSPSPFTPRSSPTPTSTTTPPAAKAADNEPLMGNPNVVLVSLGKLLSQDKEQPIKESPTFCSQCGSVLESCYNNRQVKDCRYCRLWDLNKNSAQIVYQDKLFLLNPDEPLLSAADTLLIFCIDASGSMSITFNVTEGEKVVHKSRLQFVQDAVLQCVQRLSEQQPEVRVGLITFNYQVKMHGYANFKSRVVSGTELNNKYYLKKVAADFPSPPPLSQTKECLQKQVMGLSANGETALGPASLLAVAMASKHPGSKVIICTDGKANAKLGNLEEEDNDARTLLSSTIFYQNLGEYAANQGVTVSVLSIEGTDCRLDELGRLADRTGGKVVIASPNQLHSEFEEIIQNRTTATHCAVTLLLPRSLRMKGEREAGHKCTREVGNVNPDTEITMQFEATDQDIGAPAPGCRVSIQLQIRYKRSNGQMMLRVFTADRDVTDDSSAALSSLSLAIIQLNSLQASAALAVRGRFLDARKENELQKQLIERAIKFNESKENHIFSEWITAMEPLYKNIHNYTRNKSVTSDSQTLTDAGAALLFTMKHSNRKSISLAKNHRP
uniref:VWFA domain-containing protein n=2 Tax=Nothobranchius kuhntae TaxID=321403 RepID=A0A1A8K5Q9_NOTKU